MMKNYTYFLVILMILLTVFSVNSQPNSQEPLKVINYNKNIDAPLTFQEMEMLKEVYKDKLQEHILNRPNRLKSVKNILRNRVVFIEVNGKNLSEYKFLSQVSLFNDYNKNLARDLKPDKATFNPLKYRFNFYSRRMEYVRVDNTNWIIKIKSQYQK